MCTQHHKGIMALYHKKNGLKQVHLCIEKIKHDEQNQMIARREKINGTKYGNQIILIFTSQPT